MVMKSDCISHQAKIKGEVEGKNPSKIFGLPNEVTTTFY